jgi:hypothetical protein
VRPDCVTSTRADRGNAWAPWRFTVGTSEQRVQHKEEMWDLIVVS